LIEQSIGEVARRRSLPPPTDRPPLALFAPVTVLANRYQICRQIASGVFARVVRAFDPQTATDVAIKIIPDAHAGDLELGILNSLKNASPAIVAFHDAFTANSELCLVFELLGRTLHSTLKCRRLGAREIRPLARDLFTALAAIHDRGIVHCDVKPENILYWHGRQDHIKLADFGTACRIGFPLFEYFQTRYYRAPEAILRLNFDGALDVWSAGCVIAEMAIGAPLFPGVDEKDQLKKFVEILGPPPEYMRAKMEADIDDVRRERKRRLKKRIEDRALADLIMRCIAWEPRDRVSAGDALADPFFQ
jgi:serine/threonine protein kinase